jgi:dTDP-L-rhamnose 4-epimerase
MKGHVLVTGGAGFIGSFLTEALLKQGVNVRVLDVLHPQVHPSGKKPAYLTNQCEFVQADIRDQEKLKKALSGMDQVVHLAARVGVGQSQYEIRDYTDVNIGGTAGLLDLWVNQYRDQIKKLVVASSMSIYGEGAYACHACGKVSLKARSLESVQQGQWEPVCSQCNSPLKAQPTSEGHRLLGDSVYAITKRVQEEMVLSVGKTYGLGVVALRFFNVYGPRQSLSNPYTGVLSIFLSRIKNKRAPIIYEDGLQTRDFVSVHDIAQACIESLKNDNLKNEVFNVGSGDPRAIRAIAESLIQAARISTNLDITQRYRKGDIRHCFADLTQILKKTNYRPQVSFEEGLRELIEWAQNEKAEDRSDQADQELRSKGLS